LFFLAMAYTRLGDKAQGLQWYGKAAAWMDKNKPQDPELRRLRDEAAALLELKVPALSETEAIPPPKELPRNR
jgi:hypothetical protein